MLKKIIYPLALASALIVGGCASNANVEQMTYRPHSAAKPRNIMMLNNIAVRDVTGTETQINHANFKAALERSLALSGLYHRVREARYELSARVIKLERQSAGLNIKAISAVHYRLENLKTEKTMYDGDIVSTYTATFSDDNVAAERANMVSEEAARANIKKLIETLYGLSVRR